MDEENESSENNNKHAELECPFTWGIDKELVKAKKKNRKLTKDEDANTRDFIPLLHLMKLVSKSYKEIVLECDESSAVENISKIDEWMKTYITTIDPKDYSVEAIKHIVDATKYFVLLHFNNEVEASEVLRGIEIPKKMNNIYKSTLNGFRAMVHFNSTAVGSCIHTEKYIRQALDENPKCGLWYFILGHNIRCGRRYKQDVSIPSAEEQNAYLKAHKLSPKSIKFGICAAQMLRECRKRETAVEILKTYFLDDEVLVLRDGTYLSIALAFIRGNELPLAKRCLDCVKQKDASNSWYLHYMGMYHKYMKQYKEAVEYLKKALDDSNYIALEDYCFCMLKIGPFNVLEYLLSILDKVLNENISDATNVKIIFHIALEFYSKRNMPMALKYFYQGALINPKSFISRIFICLDRQEQHVDVYETLTKRVFRTVEMRRSTLDEHSIEIYNDLRRICDNLSKNKPLDINKGVKDRNMGD